MNSSMRASVVLDSPLVLCDAGPHRGSRRLRLEEGRGESFERVVPVVVARNRVDRLGHALERQPEPRLVVLHRAGRIDDVGREDDEPDILGGGGAEQRIAQHVLAGVALARVADDDERERLAAADAGGRDGKAAAVERRASGLDDRADHRRAPGIGARRGPRVPDTRRPVLGVEVPAHAPDRNRGDDDRGERQPDLEPAAEGGPQRIAGRAQADGEPHARLEPPAQQRGPRHAATPVRAGPVEHALPGAALEPTSRPAGEEPKRDDDEVGECERDDDVARYRDQRRENAERRLVEAHAADVNGEQHRDERRDPAAIGGHPVDLGPPVTEPRSRSAARADRGRCPR